MQKFFEDNKKNILIAGIGVAALALLYRNVLKKRNSNETPLPNKASESQNDVAKQERAKAISAIQITYDDHHLSADTLKQIINAIIVTATPDYLKEVKENRLHRRVRREDLELFNSFYYNLHTNIDGIIKKAQKEVLREVNIPENLFEDSIVQQSNNNNNEIALARAFIPSELKKELKSTKTISLEELKEILKGRVAITKQEAENKEKIAEKLTNTLETAAILNSHVLDHIFSKYTVEEEDIDAALKIHGNDPVVQDLLMEIQSSNLSLDHLES